MEPLELPSIIESHLYKFVWVVSIAILLAAVLAGYILWQGGLWSGIPPVQKVILKSEKKRAALESLHAEAREQGVVRVSNEQKMLILKNGK